MHAMGEAGWTLGYTEGYIWVMAKYTPLDNRMVLLERVPISNDGGQTTSPPQPLLKIDDIMKALLKAMLTPRHDTNSSAGPRRPFEVTLEGGPAVFPPDVVNDLKQILKTLGITDIKTEDEDGENDDKGMDISAGWNENWYRTEVGLPTIKKTEHCLWHSMIEPDRRHPIPPLPRTGPGRTPATSPNDLAQAMAHYAQHPAHGAPTVRQIAALPQDEREEYWSLCIVKSQLILLPNHGSTRYAGGGPLAFHKIAVSDTTGKPKVEEVVSTVFRAMMEHRVRPVSLVVGQPSICGLESVDKYESAFEGTGVDVLLGGKDSLEEQVGAILAMMEN